jgi:hypothetical protein
VDAVRFCPFFITEFLAGAFDGAFVGAIAFFPSLLFSALGHSTSWSKSMREAGTHSSKRLLKLSKLQ